MTPDRRALLDEVAGCLPPLERPVLVAVDGADGSGKTWFADELAEVLREAADRPVVRASVDDFHHPREHRYAAGRTGETVWERSFDYLALRRRLIDPWRRGPGTSYVARWHDLCRDARVEQPPGEVPDSAVLVVDGVFLQRPELYDAWDLTVWLDVPDEERYVGWPRGTACRTTPATPTSSATSTRSGSTARPATRSVSPTGWSTTPIRSAPCSAARRHPAARRAGVRGTRTDRGETWREPRDRGPRARDEVRQIGYQTLRAEPPIGTRLRTRPTTIRMIPIHVRIEMLAIRPMSSRIRPRTTTGLPPSSRHLGGVAHWDHSSRLGPG